MKEVDYLLQIELWLSSLLSQEELNTIRKSVTKRIEKLRAESILSEPERTEAKDEGRSEAGRLTMDDMQIISDVFDKHSVKNTMYVPLLDSMRFTKAATEYSTIRMAQVRAELEKAKADCNHYIRSYNRMLSELSEANKRIAELEQDIIWLTDSAIIWRVQRDELLLKRIQLESELSEETKRISELEEQNDRLSSLLLSE